MGLGEVFSSMQVAADYWLISDKLSSIEGFLDPIEGYALTILAQHAPGTGSIVEIGSYAGKSTAYLAQGAKRARREKVVAVDHFQGSPEHQKDGEFESGHIADGVGLFEVFQKNLKSTGIDDWVHVIRADSAEANKSWSHPIRLLFIDGDHSYEASRQDYESWSRWLTPEGLVAFHDIGIFPGVTKFYDELVEGGTVKEILSVGTLRVVSRIKS